MLATVFAALLTSVGVVSAGCANDAACQSLGCKDNFQVVLGQTEIVEARTTQPPYNLDGFPGATSVGAQDVGGGTTSVTWKASEPTTLVVPKSTPAANGNPGTTYFVATSTFEYNGVKYEKPYVTSTTSTSYTKTETSTSTTTTTTTTTETTTTTSTTTATETTTYCPPPPPCPTQAYQGWTSITLTKSGTAIKPVTININPAGNAWFWLTDIEYKQESFYVTIDGQPLGTTGAFLADKSSYQPNPDAAISAGWSWGKFPVPAGAHSIVINGVNFDTGYASYKASWKLEPRCD